MYDILTWNYIFLREKRRKDFIQRNDEEKTLTYKPITDFEFVPEESVYSEFKKFQIFNAPFLVRFWSA